MPLIKTNLGEEFKRARTGAESGQLQNVIAAPMPLMVRGGPGKAASMSRTAVDVEKLSPLIRDPRLSPDNFYLPYYDPTSGEPSAILNEWISYYYRYQPLVGNAIDIHSQLPISRFGLTGVQDPAIMRVYEETAEDLNLIENMYYFLHCWFLFGEVMPYFWWSEKYNRFVHMTFIDTSKVRVLGHYLSFSDEGDSTFRYELMPDDCLRHLVNSSDSYDREIIRNLDPVIVSAVRRGMNLELDNFSTELIASTSNPWEIRGTPLLLGILKDLVYGDTLRMAQTAVAQRLITPIWLWKLGTPGPDGYMPTDSDLQAFRETLIAANEDPSFTIVSHYAVTAEVIGAAGKILPITNELTWVDKRIMTRLFTNEAITTGQGPTFATASIALRALMSRYLPIRAMMERVFKRKVFLPIALANGFLDKDGNPIIPDFNWRHKQSLLDDSSIRSSLLELRRNGEMPLKVIADSMDLDYEEMLMWLEKEQGTIVDRPLYQARTTFVANAVAQAKEGFKGLLEVVKSTFLRSSQEETVKEDDKGKSVPDGYDADQNATLPQPGTSDNLGAPNVPKGDSPRAKPPQKPKDPTGPTQAPVGGETGERVLGRSFLRDKQIQRARKPSNYQPFVVKQSQRTSEQQVEPINDWQERLLTSPMDRSCQDSVLGAENHILNVYTQMGDDFARRLVDTWKSKGNVSLSDFEHAVRDSISQVNDQSATDFRDRLVYLYEKSQAAVTEQLKRSGRGRRYLGRRAALQDDRQRNMEDALDGAFSRVTTVSSEVLDKLRDMLHANQESIPADVVSTLFAELDMAGVENLSEADLIAKFKEIWDKQRYIYQRIVRTETINMYSHASLMEWHDAGYKRVTRREINDFRTCGYCRALDGLDFDLNKLLELDYPLIQNPDTKAYDGHPQCRGYFLPSLSIDDWDEFVLPPGANFDNVEDISIGNTQVTGAPVGIADAITEALQENDIQKSVSIVPDVVDTPAWLDSERQRILREIEDSGKARPSNMQLDLMVDELREDQRGNIALYELPNGDALVSGFSFYADDPHWFVVREQAKKQWETLTEIQKSTVQQLYDYKIVESKSTIDMDGVEIIGGTSGGFPKGFITPAASQDVLNYFVESSFLYQEDSYKLEFLDPPMYQFLRDEIFIKEYR